MILLVGDAYQSRASDHSGLEINQNNTQVFFGQPEGIKHIFKWPEENLGLLGFTQVIMPKVSCRSCDVYTAFEFGLRNVVLWPLALLTNSFICDLYLLLKLYTIFLSFLYFVSPLPHLHENNR